MDNKQKKRNQDKFPEMMDTFERVLSEIDALIEGYKSRVVSGELKTIDQEFPNRKEFLMHIERLAIDRVAKSTLKTPSGILEKWRLMTLPFPLYQKMEDGTIPCSKAKLATAMSFDPDDPESIKCAEAIAEFMESCSDTNQIKAFVYEQSKRVWRPSTAVMNMILKQHLTKTSFPTTAESGDATQNITV